MSNTPETEVLRIEGNVTVLKDVNLFEEDFNAFMRTRYYQWNGTISPLNPDAESFMVSVERKYLDSLKNDVKELTEIIEWNNSVESDRDKAFLDLAEQLRQKQEEYNLLSIKYISERGKDKILENEIAALELRLKVKDSPIKAGLKRAWKWFYEECLIHWFKPNQQ